MKMRLSTSILPRSVKSVLQTLAMSAALAVSSPAVCAQDQDVSEVVAAMNGMMQATLEASYTVTYHRSVPHLIFKDDIYYRKDLVTIDYGFQFVADKEPDIVWKGDKCILTATVRNSPFRPANRGTLVRASTDGEMQLKDEDGNNVDLDRIMNMRVLEEELKYRTAHMEIARSKISQYFRIYAAKLGCEPRLEFAK
ncbi:hypothetical protein [Succinimonas sp.]|uniref:hypothetical protein n=1 Tax=Succinimonas sp. TaxID=1936151 RepID=UPI0038632AC5